MSGTGFLFTFLTGVMWTGVGICFSAVARRGIDFISFMLVYALFMSAMAWAIFPDYANIDQVSVRDWLLLAGTMLPYGFLGMMGFWAVRTAMRSGHNGVVWALAQSAMLFPFLFGIVAFGERYGYVAWIGFILLATGILMLALLRKSESHNYNNRWIAMAFLAFVLIGVSQIFSMLPNRFELSPVAQTLRVPLMIAPGLLWAVPVLCRRRPVERRILLFAAAYAVLVISGQFSVFRALDAMSRAGSVALVYPLAIGVSIILFFLYSRVVVKEKASVPMVAAVIALVSGIFLMSCK